MVRRVTRNAGCRQLVGQADRAAAASAAPARPRARCCGRRRPRPRPRWRNSGSCSEHLRETAAPDRARAGSRPVRPPRWKYFSSHVGLRLGPAFAAKQNLDTVLGELRQQHIVQDLRTAPRPGASARTRIAFNWSATDRPSGPPWAAPASSSSLRPATRISKNSSRLAQEMHRNLTPFEQRDAAVLGLLQHALIELQERQLPVDVELRGLQICVIHVDESDASVVTVP